MVVTVLSRRPRCLLALNRLTGRALDMIGRECQDNGRERLDILHVFADWFRICLLAQVRYGHVLDH